MKTTDIEQRLREGRVELLDVRTGVEYRSGHIAGAEHLPVDELEQLTEYRGPAEGRELCLICQSGKRAERAARHLSGLGVQACVMEGGMNAWADAGLPVVRESGAPLPLLRQVQIIIGLVNLLGLALGVLVSPWWLAVPAFTSAGLLTAGITGTCGLALLLARLPWNRT